jgi:TonB-linked SusC/RagA family outer membrane protein
MPILSKASAIQLTFKCKNMKKKQLTDPYKGVSLIKLWRIMKITLLLIIIGIMNTYAKVYSQDAQISVNIKNGTVTDLFKAIEQKTEYRIFYKTNLVSDAKKVTLNETNKSVSSLLSEVLSERNLSFDLIDKVIVITPSSMAPQQIISGKVVDATTNEPLIGVGINVKGTSKRAITDVYGKYSIDASKPNAVLVFSYIGYITQEIPINGQTIINVKMAANVQNLGEVVVVGYGSQKKESITGSISGITAKDISVVHGGATVSSGLAGKIAGVTFRMPDGRPGSSATVQIRNFGPVLYVIDGIQKDEGQFNNISPNDIETITVLKDASAAIYGVKAANGVVVVTTKHGTLNTKNTIEFNALYGYQNWTTFPKVGDAYAWQLGKVYADVNQTGQSSITPAELAKWKAGTDPAYRSFDWYKAIVTPNMPQSTYNLNASGGNENINYYVSLSRLDQDAVIKQYKFDRTNFQSNVDAKISKSLKIGVAINGRIEERVNPGVPGGDDYWVPRFAIIRNTPMMREFANDNPLYMNDIGDNSTNFALMNYATSGKYQSDWYVLQTNFNAEYKFPIKGLTAKGMVSYYYADQLMNNHEYTYNAYKYDPVTKTYNVSGGSQNPWQERQTSKILETVTQGQLNYTNTFGKHTVNATFVTERSDRTDAEVWVHVVPPLNPLDIMQVSTLTDYNDSKTELARVGYVGRLNYNYADKYYFEASGRRDASSMFSPANRWGNFYSVSGGWRVTGENFYKDLTAINSILTDFKVRASYGKLGDDTNIGINPQDFTYINGYSYPAGGGAVLDGQFVPGAQDRGLQATNLTWTISKITDIGADFTMLKGKITGAIDYFYRKRTGLPNTDNTVILPNEVGFVLPQANVGSDAQMGGEFNVAYNTKIDKVDITIGGNWSYSRKKDLTLNSNPQFGNSWDYYRNSTINRYDGIYWGYQVTGQFQSQAQIDNYKINNDGKGNKTQLPGDFIYKDQNGDGVINQLDQRPIGYNTNGAQPMQNYGLNISLAWNGFDFRADFSGGAGYSYVRNWEMAWPFQNGGNLLSEFANNSWHRVDPYNVNSAWVSGKYPALTFNNGGGNNYGGSGATASFWVTPVHYFRARTIELGYSLPKSIISKMKIQKARIYINTYDLFSIDNMQQYGIETETNDGNGMQYPQNRIVNFGVNLSF